MKWCEIRTKYVRMSSEFAPLSTVSLSHTSQSLSLPLFVTMSQQILSQLASLQSRLDPAAHTPAQSHAPPVAHHLMEEATYQSGALAVDDVVGPAASLDRSPEVIHIDLRSPSRNSYLGGRPGPQICGGNSASYSPHLSFCI